MTKKLALLLTLLIVLTKVPDATLKARAETFATIYIRTDGSVDPSTAPIQRNGDLYTLTSNITSDADGIVIERSNIVLDGVGYTLQGIGMSQGGGIYLSAQNNVTIKRIIIQGFDGNGIHLYRMTNSTISGSIINANNGYGVRINNSLNNTVIENTITANNLYGMFLQFAYRITISGNNIINNYDGISFDEAHNNTIIQNNITTSNRYGFHAYKSFGNTIVRNVLEMTKYYGIRLRECFNTNIAENAIKNNKEDGIRLEKSSSNTIIRNSIFSNNDTGIILDNSSENKILENEVTSNGIDGSLLIYSSNNILQGNTITGNEYGISLSNSSNNTIFGNTLLENGIGAHFANSFNNSIYHNNFVDNAIHWLTFDSIDFWDNSVEGNYWGGYSNVDLNNDGIGDLPQVLDVNNRDNYPLIGMFYSFDTLLGYYVNVISNSTIEDFEYSKSDRIIKMYVSNATAAQISGFCRLSVPMSLMIPYKVIIDNGLTEVLNFNGTLYANGTHRWIYFAYEHSTREIAIIPHYDDYFMVFIIATLFTIVALLAIIVYRKKYHFYEKIKRG